MRISRGPTERLGNIRKRVQHERFSKLSIRRGAFCSLKSLLIVLGVSIARGVLNDSGRSSIVRQVSIRGIHRSLGTARVKCGADQRRKSRATTLQHLRYERAGHGTSSGIWHLTRILGHLRISMDNLSSVFLLAAEKKSDLPWNFLPELQQQRHLSHYELVQLASMDAMSATAVRAAVGAILAN